MKKHRNIPEEANLPSVNNLLSGLGLDASGNLYIADTGNNRIRKAGTNGIITTVAGNGRGTYSGDGGLATGASLYYPCGLAFDAFGNLYIADLSNNRVRKVDTSGNITTVAGNGTGTYAGDNGPAMKASLYYPCGLAFDSSGNLYIAEDGNERIRKVDTNGIITTAAGNGTAGYSGDGGAATNASLQWRLDVASDAFGNLYIDDLWNQRIRKVDTNGIITTVAGNGIAGSSGDGGAATGANLVYPTSVALDPFGNLYIADTDNNSIRKVDTNGIITKVAGNGRAKYAGDGGVATSASLDTPGGVDLDACGNLYIADAGNQRIREVHFAGYPMFTITNVSAINAGSYAVIIATPYGSVTSAVVSLTVEAPPAITVQPASQLAVAGTSPTFSVGAAGSGPFGYLWYFESTNLMQSGASSTFTVADVSTNEAGNYTVVVRNAYGSVTSLVGTLTVGLPPSVTAQSGGQTVLSGTDVSMSVTVNGGGPYTYQWQWNGVNLPNNIITTVAGNGIGTNAGDGGAAINASLQYPRGVTFDAAGNLYIADQNNNRIRKVDTNGVITTVAGNGTNGYTGDGGAATNASLNGPTSVALDAAGNLYICDMSNGRIRKVDTNAIITTIATLDQYGPVGVALDAAGNLYAADQNSGEVVKVNSNGTVSLVAGGNGYFGNPGDGGPATAAVIVSPQGVSFDAAGDLYIADQGSQRIRKVNLNGIISTVAGNGTYGYSGDGGAATNAELCRPYGVTLDASDNLYIADYINNRIRMVDTNGIISTVVGNGGTNYSGDGGAATNASLNNPACVALDAAGNLYIADYANHRIREVHFAGYPTLALTNVGASNAGSYTVVVTSPYGVVTSAVAALTVLFPPSVTAAPASQTVPPGTNVTFTVAVSGTGPLSYQWQFNGTNLPNGIISTVAGSSRQGAFGDGGAATSASLYHPGDVGFDAVGDLYIADFSNNRIRKVDANGIITTVAGNGNAGYSGDGGAATSAGLYWPDGLSFDASGNLYISEQGDNRIRMVGTNGVITTVAGNGTNGYSGDGGAATNARLKSPAGVALDAVGNLYIADYGNQRIRKVDTNGMISTAAGNGTNGYSGDGGAATNASLHSPLGVALDALGNLYIGDSSNQRIRKVDTNGVITTVAGNGTNGYSGDGGAAISARLNSPSGVLLDAFGNLYIADGGNSRIRKVDASGFITNVAGNGTATFAGDGGAATSASLDDPTGAALDAAGNLYIADNLNNRIRKVLLSAGYPAFTVNNVSAVNAGSYTIVITSPYGSVTSAVASLTVEAPPIITFQTTSQTVLPGSSPAFSVTVAGSGPFGYSWYFAGTNLLQSGTNSTLTLPGVSAINGGNYMVVVTNAYGSVTSQVAALAVLAPPLVISQPAGQTVLLGTNVIFNVTLANTGPSAYQWQLNGTNLPNNIITTVAGNGTNGYSGDGGAASNAQLSQPYRMALDAAGNLYITDTGNNRVRKVDANGVITTVAGGGSGGNGGAATNALLSRPTGVTLDSGGNLYIADSLHNRIRSVDTNGIITTVAGNGAATFAGDGGAAANASLSCPYGVAFDAFGRLYIADTANNRIRKVDNSGVITTLAGESSSPYESNGNGGAATNAWLLEPSGLALDAFGNLYIAQVNSAWVRRVDVNGIITAAAGNDEPGFSGDGGAATNANLDGPFDVAVDALGDLYIADSLNDRIRKVDANGIISTVAGNGSGTYAGDGGAATNASLYFPSGVAFDAAGNLYIADTYNNRIREVLLSASYPTLTLPSVSLTNAGSYTLVVSNTYGVVTSAVAALNVAVAAPQIMTSDGCLGFVASQFGFNLSGAAGQTIVVDGSADLVNWTPLCTNTVGSGPLYFYDPCWTSFGWRFYRARLP